MLAKCAFFFVAKEYFTILCWWYNKNRAKWRIRFFLL